jgi:DNA processing protein
MDYENSIAELQCGCYTGQHYRGPVRHVLVAPLVFPKLWITTLAGVNTMIAQYQLAFPEDDSTESNAGDAPESAGIEGDRNGDQEGGDGHTMSEQQFALHLLALGQISGIGVRTLQALMWAYGNLANVWDDDPDHLKSVLSKANASNTLDVLRDVFMQREHLFANSQRMLEKLREDNVAIISYQSRQFPKQLLTIPNAPLWLFVEGNPKALHAPLVGIVGTRNPSRIGIQTAAQLARIVSEQGLGIVSGLAEGIDDAAHRMGLFCSAVQVAVLGTGIDVVFPTITAKTRRHIIRAGGAVISEYLPGDTRPNRARFVERNRIQAALCLALAPVESQVPSGTIHTFNFAEKYKRPIFGVQRSLPAPNNQILNLLRDHGHPIFDLATSAGISDMLRWLEGTINLVSRAPQPFRLEREKLFRGVLQQLSDVSRFVPLTEEDAIWLQDQIAKLIAGGQLATNEDAQDGG